MILNPAEIIWAEPIVAIHPDPEWEREVKARLGMVTDVLRRVSPSPWVRRVVMEWEVPPMTHITGHLAAKLSMVVGQENACRYCYGATRAAMRVLGHSERYITEMERSVQLAELDEREYALIQFARNLARSNPRPSHADRERLIAMGYPPEMSIEAAVYVASSCFYNRVATFVSAQPVLKFERLAYSWMIRIIGPMLARKLLLRATPKVSPKPASGQFAKLISTLGGLPFAPVLNDSLEAAFSPSLLSQPLKLLMFGVVSRLLDCGYCQSECRSLSLSHGMSAGEFNAGLDSLRPERLSPEEQRILAWTRETVRYDTPQIQRLTRELGEAIGPEKLVEA
ncbi:MAG: hypothetical protein OEW39_03925, partial [Deltaproteobacteria bacterium]|nr:hypothetical protein [Deltaproteobacteria bacterium]